MADRLHPSLTELHTETVVQGPDTQPYISPLTAQEFAERNKPAEFSPETKILWEKAQTLARQNHQQFTTAHILLTLLDVHIPTQVILQQVIQDTVVLPTESPLHSTPPSEERLREAIAEAIKESEAIVTPVDDDTSIKPAIQRRLRARPQELTRDVELFRDGLFKYAQIRSVKSIDPLHLLLRFAEEPPRNENTSIGSDILDRVFGTRRSAIQQAVKNSLPVTNF